MNEYSVDKLRAYPETIKKLRDTGEGDLISVHLMPQNLCNQSCSFCSYRLPGNKNALVFNDKKHIPLEELEKLLVDLHEMGVKGVEVTGGGEPLAYPYTRELFTLLRSFGFKIGLVTNGTLLRDDDLGRLIASSLSWVRVSIDAGSPQSYALMRKSPAAHYKRAWEAVGIFRKYGCQPDFKLGVGFVLSNENMNEVRSFVEQAKMSGADNVRLSAPFTHLGADYFEDKSKLTDVMVASEDAAGEFTDENFTVHNLLIDRLEEGKTTTVQDYKRCYTKDVLCVVEGECKVYTCCTFTGSDAGCYGKFTDYDGGFRELWEKNTEWRREFRADKYCKVPCLYRERNLAIERLLASDPRTVTTPEDIIHKEFV